MEKPIKRNEAELQNNFVDYLFELYEPQKNSAGEYFYNGLDYLTNEMSYLASETEKEFVEENGLAPIAFLELLRIQMSKTSGFGICITNKDLKKAMAAMSIDYSLDMSDMENYYKQLIEYHLLLLITDGKGNEYATTTQQIFNWEYKMWTRYNNNKYQKKRRSNQSATENTNIEENITDSSNDIPIAPTEPAKPLELPVDDFTVKDFF